MCLPCLTKYTGNIIVYYNQHGNSNRFTSKYGKISRALDNIYNTTGYIENQKYKLQHEEEGLAENKEHMRDGAEENSNNTITNVVYNKHSLYGTKFYVPYMFVIVDVNSIYKICMCYLPVPLKNLINIRTYCCIFIPCIKVICETLRFQPLFHLCYGSIF